MKQCIVLTSNWDSQENVPLNCILKCNYPKQLISLVDPIESIHDSHRFQKKLHKKKNIIHMKPFLHPELSDQSTCFIKIQVPFMAMYRIEELFVVSSSKSIEMSGKLINPSLLLQSDVTESEEVFYSHVSPKKHNITWFSHHYAFRHNTNECSIRFLDSYNQSTSETVDTFIRSLTVNLVEYEWSDLELSSLRLSPGSPKFSYRSKDEDHKLVTKTPSSEPCNKTPYEKSTASSHLQARLSDPSPGRFSPGKVTGEDSSKSDCLFGQKRTNELLISQIQKEVVGLCRDLLMCLSDANTITTWQDKAILLLRGISFLTQKYFTSQQQPSRDRSTVDHSRMTKSSNSSPTKHSSSKNTPRINYSANSSNRSSCASTGTPFEHPAFTLLINPDDLLNNSEPHHNKISSGKSSSDSSRDDPSATSDLETPKSSGEIQKNSLDFPSLNHTSSDVKRHYSISGHKVLARDETIVCSTCPSDHALENLVRRVETLEERIDKQFDRIMSKLCEHSHGSIGPISTDQ